jgi:hypothetical protein
MMNKLHVFATITKIDVAKRTVTGQMTAEVVDKANEILDYETSAPLFKGWSAGFAKNTGATGAEVSYGNVRSMHKPVAAGKLIEFVADDAAKAMTCTAEIVDDDEWQKCLKGVYTGFSFGGQYVKKWTDDRDPKGVTRYTANASEVSLVDNPCVPTALFTMVKADGVEVQEAFNLWAPDTTMIGHKAEELAKAAGTGGIGDYLEAAEKALVEDYSKKAVAGDGAGEDKETPLDPEGDGKPVDDPEADKADKPVDWGIAQVFRVAVDGSVFETKALAKAHVTSLQTATAGNPALADALKAAKAALAGPAVVVTEDAAKALAGARTATAGMQDGFAALKVYRDQHADQVQKGMYQVSRFGDALESLANLQISTAWESAREGDSSPVPASLAAGIKTLAECFTALAQEELQELLASMKDESPAIDVQAYAGSPDEIIVCAVRGMDAFKIAQPTIVEKMGARNSKVDAAHIQNAHDSAAKAGAKCDPANCPEADKLAPVEEVQKLEIERDALKAQVDETVPVVAEMTKAFGIMQDNFAKVQAELEVLKAQPTAMPAIQPGTEEATRAAAAAKIDDPVEVLGKLLDGMSPEALQKLLMKRAQTHSERVFTGA